MEIKGIINLLHGHTVAVELAARLMANGLLKPAVCNCSVLLDSLWEIYYYTTYDNHQIIAVNMHKEKLDDIFLIRYPLAYEEQIHFQN